MSVDVLAIGIVAEQRTSGEGVNSVSTSVEAVRVTNAGGNSDVNVNLEFLGHLDLMSIPKQ